MQARVVQGSRLRKPAFVRCFITCGVLIGLAADAPAQEAVGSVYVTAGVSFPTQPPVPAGSPPPFSAPGGSTAGWLVGGGVFVSPRLSIEGELSSTGVMRSREWGRYDILVVDERRDRMVSFGVKGHLAWRSAVRVEPVGGIVLIRGRSSSEVSWYRLTFPGRQLLPGYPTTSESEHEATARGR